MTRRHALSLASAIKLGLKGVRTPRPAFTRYKHGTDERPPGMQERDERTTKLREPHTESKLPTELEDLGLSDKVRRLFSSHPHGLAAVVAPSHPELTAKPQSALLVSSLNTVTLHPKPYLSFNIKTPSTTYRALRDSHSFTASGLSDPSTAQLFVAKAQKDGIEPWKGVVGRKGQVLTEHGGTWWCRCEWREGMGERVGDHVIVIGEVVEAGGLEFDRIERRGREKEIDDMAMVYWRGKYRNVGRVMEHNVKNCTEGLTRMRSERGIKLIWTEHREYRRSAKSRRRCSKRNGSSGIWRKRRRLHSKARTGLSLKREDSTEVVS